MRRAWTAFAAPIVPGEGRKELGDVDATDELTCAREGGVERGETCRAPGDEKVVCPQVPVRHAGVVQRPEGFEDGEGTFKTVAVVERAAGRHREHEHKRLRGHLAEQQDGGAEHACTLGEIARKGEPFDLGAGAQSEVTGDERAQTGEGPESSTEPRSAGIAVRHTDLDLGAVGEAALGQGVGTPVRRMEFPDAQL